MMFPGMKDLAAIGPQLLLTGFGVIVLLFGAAVPKLSARFLAAITLVGLVAAAIPAVSQFSVGGEATPVMQGMLMADTFTAFATLVLLLGTAISVLLSVRFLEREDLEHPEYFALMLFATLGGVVMASSINLITLFIGLEVLSIPLYILAGYDSVKRRSNSNEASLKYFLLGSFASAFFLYGIALLYGATGTINVQEIATTLGDTRAGGASPEKNNLLLAGLGLLLVGFSFKVAVVPFHFWAPDVYEGSPTPVTAFMSVLAKTAGFAAFVRVLTLSVQEYTLQVNLSAVLASLAALTMLFGNVVAVVQPNIKRMLAYSSVAHAGYMLAGVVAAVRPSGAFGAAGLGPSGAVSAILLYSLAYTVSNLGAFAVLISLRKNGDEVLEIKDFAGLGKRHPWAAAMMALFMLSLAGLPPSAGFFAKLFIIQSLVAMNSPLIWLIVLLVLTSTVSFFYYLGVVRAMYMDSGEERDSPVLEADLGLRFGLALAVAGTVFLGIWSGSAMGWAEQASRQLIESGSSASAMR